MSVYSHGHIFSFYDSCWLLSYIFITLSLIVLYISWCSSNSLPRFYLNSCPPFSLLPSPPHIFLCCHTHSLKHLKSHTSSSLFSNTSTLLSQHLPSVSVSPTLYRKTHNSLLTRQCHLQTDMPLRPIPLSFFNLTPTIPPLAFTFLIYREP